MWRTMLLVLALSMFAGRGMAQEPAGDPVLDKHGGEPLPDPTAGLPVSPSSAEAGIESQVGIGDRAPDFDLESSNGGRLRLADLKGRWAVLAFTESRRDLAPLAAADTVVRVLGAQLVGVCGDAPAALRTFARQAGLAFPLLADVTRQIAQVFGTFDEDNGTISPALVVVDPRGVVRLTVLGSALHADEVGALARHTIAGQ